MFGYPDEDIAKQDFFGSSQSQRYSNMVDGLVKTCSWAKDRRK
jgi:hypothetical protein